MKKHVKLISAFLFAAMCGTNSQASSFRLILQATASPFSTQFGTSPPFQQLSSNFSLEVEFSANDASVLEFGDQGCGIYEGSGCVAYGYTATDLVVKINGTTASGWRFGINNQSHSGIPFDLKSKNFFTKQNLQYPIDFWLPLINDSYPGSSISLGDLYVSIGGMAFAPNWVTVIDSVGNRAIGIASASSSLITEVPEPSSLPMALFGLSGFFWQHGKRRVSRIIVKT